MAVNYLNSVPKLVGRENYADWAFAVENVFILEGLSKCIDGSETDTVLVSKAKAKLILTLDPTLYIHVKDSKSAKEVWDVENSSIRENYSQQMALDKLQMSEIVGKTLQVLT